jgi:hypothetical protein
MTSHEIGDAGSDLGPLLSPPQPEMCAYLLDRTTRKADNKRASTPGNTLERIYGTHQYSGSAFCFGGTNL